MTAPFREHAYQWPSCPSSKRQAHIRTHVRTHTHTHTHTHKITLQRRLPIHLSHSQGHGSSTRSQVTGLHILYFHPELNCPRIDGEGQVQVTGCRILLDLDRAEVVVVGGGAV